MNPTESRRKPPCHQIRCHRRWRHRERTYPSLYPVLQGATVVAVSDINAESARAAVARRACRRKSTPTATMLSSPAMSTLSLSPRGIRHTKSILAAIAAGKPVFCEKPLAMSAEGRRRIVDAEMKAGRRRCRWALCALTMKATWR
ncbi:hypothetical protein DMH17_05310 [Raoultella planticola]|nr:hypothetical protein [Raoultella planticola]